MWCAHLGVHGAGWCYICLAWMAVEAAHAMQCDRCAAQHGMQDKAALLCMEITGVCHHAPRVRLVLVRQRIAVADTCLAPMPQKPASHVCPFRPQVSTPWPGAFTTHQ